MMLTYHKFNGSQYDIKPLHSFLLLLQIDARELAIISLSTSLIIIKLFHQAPFSFRNRNILTKPSSAFSEAERLVDTNHHHQTSIHRERENQIPFYDDVRVYVSIKLLWWKILPPQARRFCGDLALVASAFSNLRSH